MQEHLRELYEPVQFGSDYFFHQIDSFEMHPFGFLFEPDGSRTRICLPRSTAHHAGSRHPSGFMRGTGS
jgi:hypothetical protein